MTLKLKDRERILSKEQLKEVRDRMKAAESPAFPRITLGMANEDIYKLLDYIDFLKEENDRLRSSIT